MRLAAIPSSPSRWVRRRPIRLLALLAVRDDLRYLPGYIASVGPQTDGIVALDDGSSDGSAEFLESCEQVIELIRVAPDRPIWDEVGNYRRLVEAGLRHGGDWLVSLDADERVEREFRSRLEWVIARGRLFGLSSYQVRLRELWDSPDHYRADGIWGEKIRARIFRARPGASFDDRPLHGLKVPLEEWSASDAIPSPTSSCTTCACSGQRIVAPVGSATSSRIPTRPGSRGSATPTSPTRTACVWSGSIRRGATTGAESHKPPDDVGERARYQQRAAAQQQARSSGSAVRLAWRRARTRRSAVPEQRPPCAAGRQLREHERPPPPRAYWSRSSSPGAGRVPVDRAHVGRPRDQVVGPEALLRSLSSPCRRSARKRP